MKIIRIFLLVLIIPVLLCACEAKNNVVTSQENNEFHIVTSFYPMYIHTINIAKDIPGVDVVNMTEPQTGCLHDYQLSPADLKKLDKANAFVVNGAGMEAFLNKVTSQLPKIKIIEASEGIQLIKNESDGEDNPHVWVSITDAIKQVQNIGKQLADIDAKNAEKYKANTEAYVKKLEAEKTKMHNKLDGIKNKDIVTFHEAFPYFAKEFNLNIVAVIEREPGSEPSAGQLADTIQTVKKIGIKALFAEPQYSPKAAESIANQTGAKVYSLDPVATGMNKADYDAYIEAMDNNLKSLSEALK